MSPTFFFVGFFYYYFWFSPCHVRQGKIGGTECFSQSAIQDRNQGMTCGGRTTATIRGKEPSGGIKKSSDN
jgi:hypothetical protein